MINWNTSITNVKVLVNAKEKKSKIFWKIKWWIKEKLKLD